MTTNTARKAVPAKATAKAKAPKARTLAQLLQDASSIQGRQTAADKIKLAVKQAAKGDTVTAQGHILPGGRITARTPVPQKDRAKVVMAAVKSGARTPGAVRVALLAKGLACDVKWIGPILIANNVAPLPKAPTAAKVTPEVAKAKRVAVKATAVRNGASARRGAQLPAGKVTAKAPKTVEQVAA